MHPLYVMARTLTWGESTLRFLAEGCCCAAPGCCGVASRCDCVDGPASPPAALGATCSAGERFMLSSTAILSWLVAVCAAASCCCWQGGVAPATFEVESDFGAAVAWPEALLS